MIKQVHCYFKEDGSRKYTFTRGVPGKLLAHRGSNVSSERLTHLLNFHLEGRFYVFPNGWTWFRNTFPGTLPGVRK